jgi:hypothetical protein
VLHFGHVRRLTWQVVRPSSKLLTARLGVVSAQSSFAHSSHSPSLCFGVLLCSSGVVGGSVTRP